MKKAAKMPTLKGKAKPAAKPLPAKAIAKKKPAKKGK